MVAVCGVLAVLAGSAAGQVGRFDARLYDTGTASAAPLAGEVLAQRAGWRVVGKGDLQHRFAGDVVIWNGQQALVLRRQARWAELYSITPAGPRLRASLSCAAKGKAPTAGVKVTAIVKNTPAAVALTVAFSSESPASATLTLTRGRGLRRLTVRPAEGTATLHVECPARYVVVPNHHADDMLFTSSAGHVGLPAESHFLNLLAGGDGILACVWQGRGLHASAAITAGAKAPPQCRSQIDCVKDRNIYLVLLEGQGIWRGGRAAGAAGRAPAWRPPFRAKWRATRGRGDGPAVSCDLARRPTTKPDAAVSGDLCVVYPIDRAAATDSEEATPMDVFCVSDVVWNTLGVGPCQYLLDTEGLSGPENATPTTTLEWLNANLKKRRGRPSREQVDGQIDQMGHCLVAGAKRVSQYGDLARRAKELILLAKGRGPWTKEDQLELAALGRRASEMEAGASAALTECKQQAISVAMKELSRAAHGPDASARVGSGAAHALRIEAVQNRAMAQCRMQALWLRQQCASLARQGGKAAKPAGVIQELVDKFLQP